MEQALSGSPARLGDTHAPSYHAYNFAVTAWHMTDWVWEGSSAEQPAEIFARLAGTGARRKTAFQNGARKRSRAIHICRQIATGSKHVTVTDHPEPHVRAEIRWKRSEESGHPYSLVISDSDKEQPALDVFRQVLFLVLPSKIGNGFWENGGSSKEPLCSRQLATKSGEESDWCHSSPSISHPGGRKSPSSAVMDPDRLPLRAAGQFGKQVRHRCVPVFLDQVSAGEASATAAGSAADDDHIGRPHIGKGESAAAGACRRA